jgi:hypothetical protein
MHLFLAWRVMEDRIGSIAYTIERCLWGDSRARHTFLIACTDEHPLLVIEIDVCDHKKGIHKGMRLNIHDLEEVPDTICKIELIGETSSPKALENLIRAAQNYVKEHPNYHVLSNNCRTFVEYLIDQIPQFRNSVPRKNGSILEYYHSREKDEHPGALVKSEHFLKEIHDLHRRNRQYKYAGKLVFNLQIFKQDHDNVVQEANTQL